MKGGSRDCLTFNEYLLESFASSVHPHFNLFSYCTLVCVPSQLAASISAVVYAETCTVATITQLIEIVMMEQDNVRTVNYTSPNIAQDVTIQSVESTISIEGQIMYKAVVQGIFLLCLSTVVGGVMVLFICLNIVKECKVYDKINVMILQSFPQLLYTWMVRPRHKEECPPTYSEATKPPSYAVRISQERGPPEYSQVCALEQRLWEM